MTAMLRRFGDGRVSFDGGEVANLAAIAAGVDSSSGRWQSGGRWDGEGV
jgi:hypothetical protein